MAGSLSFEGLLAPYAVGDDLRRLVRYAELLERWSAAHNLVSWGTREELVQRHIADALAGQAVLGARGCLLDVGSGAGLPGIPLLAAVPEWRGVLLEPRQKRWAFLRLVARELDLQVEVVRQRYQEYRGSEGPFDVVTARALGGYGELVRWSRNQLKDGGRVLLWATVDLERRLRELPGWRVLSSPLVGTERGRLVQMVPCFT
jgi:16S rRNA (guanine527-N7)-methyltransferase